MVRRILAVIGGVAWLGLSGCGPAQLYMDDTGQPIALAQTRADPWPTSAAALTSSTWMSPLGHSLPVAPLTYPEATLEGRPLHYWVIGQGPETVILFGGFHGNERSATQLTYDFLELLLRHPEVLEDRRVVVAPLVNPDGYARDTRENARGVDLNRNYPASNWAPGEEGSEHRPGLHPRSEPETRFVLALLSLYPPDRVVSVHSAAACVNWDGPAEDLAQAMSEACGLPPEPSIGYPTPGSFGTFLGIDQGIPVITLELEDHAQVGAGAAGHEKALMVAIHHPQPLPSFLPTR